MSTAHDFRCMLGRGRQVQAGYGNTGDDILFSYAFRLKLDKYLSYLADITH